MVQHPEMFCPSIPVTEKLEEYYKEHFGSDGDSVEFVKPYLRPMSSMTEGEVTELAYKVFQQPDIDIIRRWVFEGKLHPSIDGNPVMVIDWLNAHHFDYRGLIEKGLAIEAHEGMYEK